MPDVLTDALVVALGRGLQEARRAHRRALDATADAPASGHGRDVLAWATGQHADRLHVAFLAILDRDKAAEVDAASASIPAETPGQISQGSEPETTPSNAPTPCEIRTGSELVAGLDPWELLDVYRCTAAIVLEANLRWPFAAAEAVAHFAGGRIGPAAAGPRADVEP